MSEHIRLLILEDEMDDAELMLHEVVTAGFDPIWKRVETEVEYQATLIIKPDIILADYSLPQFNAMRALQILQEGNLDIPFIIVSGTIDEEQAIECMKQGASDYLFKNNLKRLGPAVQSALSLKKLRDQKHQAEHKLHESEKRFRLMVENAKDLIYRYRFYPTPGWDYVSPASNTLLGCSPEEFYRDPEFLLKLIHPDDRELLQQHIRNQGYLTHALTLRYVLKDGSIRWGEHHSTTVSDEDGDIIAVEGVARDITERKLAEEALKKSEAEYLNLSGEFKGLLDALPDTLSLLAPDLTIKWANKHAADHLGKEAKDLIGQHCYSLWYNRSAPCELCPVLKSFASGEPVSEEIRTEDGRYLDFRTIPIKDETDRIRGVVEVVRDITERKQSELDLKYAKERYRLLFEEAPVMYEISRNQEDGPVIADCNELFCKKLDHPKTEILGRPIGDFYTADSRTKMLEGGGYQRALEGLFSSEDRTFVARNGRLIETLLHSMPETDSTGTVIGTRAMFTDITERKQREKELEAIARVSRSLRTVTNRHDILPIILEEILSILKTPHGAILIIDPDTGEILLEQGRGIWFSKTGQTIPPGRSLSSYVHEVRQPYLSNDPRNDPRLLWPELLGDCQAVAGAPLVAQEELIGSLWVARQDKISSSELSLLSSMGDITANALRRATLTDLTELRLKRLISLRTIDTAINSTLDLTITLNILLEQATSQLGVDAASVRLLNPYSQTLEFKAGRGFRTKTAESSPISLGDGFSGRVALDRSLLLIKNLDSSMVYPDKGGSPVAIISSEFLNVLPEISEMKSEKFVAYCGIPLLVKGQVKGVLEIFHRSVLEPNGEWMDFLETLAGQAALAIDNSSLFRDVQRSNAKLTLAYDKTLEGWSQALDLRDKETEGHTLRVTEISVRMARAMNLSEAEIVHIRRGALLHDIGKMGIPDAILLKPGPLTDEEWVIMRKHPVYAYELLSPIPYLRPALYIPYYHHEKWDGTGYPMGLKGEQIHLAARIFAVVDVWDALTSDRPYRLAWSKEKTMAHIREGAGTHFDPKIIEIFTSLPLIDFRQGD